MTGIMQAAAGCIRFLLGFVRPLAVLAIRHPLAVLVLFLVLVFAVMFWKRVMSRSAQVRRRVRALRWRIRLRLRPGAGYASLPELWLRWGRLAALSHGRRIRPDMGFWCRFFSPASDYAVRLGRAQYGRRVYARGEDQALVLAPQRVGKSGLLADRILSHRGPLLATTTRGDLYQITAASRALQGPVEVFNPQGTAGIASTFTWDLLEPCRDVVMAHRMAGWLTGGSAARQNHGNLEWFEGAGQTALSALLWAAAVGGYSIADVFRWNQLDGHQGALHVLGTHPGASREMHAVVRRVLESNRTADSIRATIEQSLAWAMIPGLHDAVAPGRGRGFDLDEFLDRNGSVYLVASGDEDSPLTPLFRAFASWLHWSAGLAGTLTPAGRLPVPLLEALDELAVICPVDLPAMLADSAGKGILIVAVAHSRSQLAQRWGDHGAETIWALTGTKILLPGISDAKTLSDVSDLCGSVNLGEDEGKSVRIAPPELLRSLPDWRALVVRMNLSPVVVKFRPAWKRRGYRRLSRRPAPLYVPSQFLDEAVPLPELTGAAAVPAEPLSWLTGSGGGQ
jgi:type IV secretion system protein VirD4